MSANSPRKFSSFRLIGVVAAVGLILVAIFMGGAPGVFFNIPSLLLVVGLTWGMLIGLYGIEAGNFCRDALLTYFLFEGPPNPRYAAIARSGSRFSVAAGAIGSLIGVIQMLTTLDDPSKIGGGTAVALLTALYGLILSEFVFGFLVTAYSSPEDADAGNATIPMRNLGIPLAIIGFIVFTFVFIVLAFNVMAVHDMYEMLDHLDYQFPTSVSP